MLSKHFSFFNLKSCKIDISTLVRAPDVQAGACCNSIYSTSKGHNTTPGVCMCCVCARVCIWMLLVWGVRSDHNALRCIMPRRGASLYKHTRAVTVLQEGQGASFTQVQQELRCLKCEAEKLICCCFFCVASGLQWAETPPLHSTRCAFLQMERAWTWLLQTD